MSQERVSHTWQLLLKRRRINPPLKSSSARKSGFETVDNQADPRGLVQSMPKPWHLKYACTMSADHGATGALPSGVQAIPPFLMVKPGDYVIVQAQQQVAQKDVDDWWMGQVVFSVGARDPRVNTLFQVADVDDGGIYWVNGDLVTHIVWTD